MVDKEKEICHTEPQEAARSCRCIPYCNGHIHVSIGKTIRRRVKKND